LPAVAERRGCSPAAAYVELLDETDGKVIVSWPILNQDLDAVGEMFADPLLMMGLADSGAHVGQILDASQATSFLLMWVRDREAFTFEEGIRRLTSDTANFAGLTGRGVLAPGAFADVNVIDREAMFLPVPEYVYDFPGGAGRFVQRAVGYDTTIVNGEVTLVGGEPTGALPGRVLRAT
jgi:N-acyl-D-aspartate/D-glutamate deacylase